MVPYVWEVSWLKHRVRDGKRSGWSRKAMLQDPQEAKILYSNLTFPVARKLNSSRSDDRTYFT